MSAATKNGREAPTYMTVEQAAGYLGGFSAGWLYAMVEKREIPFIRIAGRRNIRFRKADLDAWMESHLQSKRAG